MLKLGPHAEIVRWIVLKDCIERATLYTRKKKMAAIFVKKKWVIFYNFHDFSKLVRFTAKHNKQRNVAYKITYIFGLQTLSIFSLVLEKMASQNCAFLVERCQNSNLTNFGISFFLALINKNCLLRKINRCI